MHVHQTYRTDIHDIRLQNQLRIIFTELSMDVAPLPAVFNWFACWPDLRNGSS